MADSLFIYLRDDTERVEWITVDGEGRMLARPTSGLLEDAARSADSKRVVVIVPGIDVITTQAQLPRVSQTRLRQMLPFSIEDRFADDIDTLMFAIGPRLASGDISAAVVAKRRLSAWLDRVHAAGLQPSAVFAVTDGVPDTPATINLVIESDTILGRRPGHSPVTLQGLSAEQAFRMLAKTDDDESALQHAMIYVDQDNHDVLKEQLAALEAQVSSVIVRRLEHGLLPTVAAKLLHDPGTNLLQGSYAPKSNWGAFVKPWRIAASLLVGLGIVMFLSVIGEYVSLRITDSQLTVAVATACEERFSTSQITQCADQVRAALRRSGEVDVVTGENFLSTLGALAQYTTAGERLETISYRNRVMDLQLSAPNIPALDRLSQDVGATGRFNVSIQSTTPDDNGIAGRIQIVGASR